MTLARVRPHIVGLQNNRVAIIALVSDGSERIATSTSASSNEREMPKRYPSPA